MSAIDKVLFLVESDQIHSIRLSLYVRSSSGGKHHDHRVANKAWMICLSMGGGVKIISFYAETPPVGRRAFNMTSVDPVELQGVAISSAC